jgi:hypothetical protein
MMIRIHEPSTTVAQIKVPQEPVTTQRVSKFLSLIKQTETNPTTNVLDQVEK